MQSRLVIVLMSVAGTAALFAVGFLLGLGVMSTPKPEQHKQIALTTTNPPAHFVDHFVVRDCEYQGSRGMVEFRCSRRRRIATGTS